MKEHSALIHWNKRVHGTQEIQMILVNKYNQIGSGTDRGGDTNSNTTYASMRDATLSAFSSGLLLE